MAKKLYLALSVTIAAIIVLASSHPAVAQDFSEEIHTQMHGAMGARDYAKVYQLAKQYWDKIDAGEIQPFGPIYARICYYTGVATYQMFKDGTPLPSEDFYKWVIHPLEEHIRQVQDQIEKKLNYLAAAYNDYYQLLEEKTMDAENNTVWASWWLILKLHEKMGFEKPVTEEIGNAIYRYINTCMLVVEFCPYPEIYKYRIRHACQLGFGIDDTYDSIFWQYYEMTFFDDGNIVAGVFLQRALDLARKDLFGKYDQCVQYLKRALKITRSKKAKAELYRNLAELTIALDKVEERPTAANYARQAYLLYPYDQDIRDLYGSTLLALSAGFYQKKNYIDALKYAEDAIEFEWEGDEEIYLILAKCEAAHGMKYKAMKHAYEAYQKACTRLDGEDLKYFRDQYKAILRQFGEESKYRKCQTVK